MAAPEPPSIARRFRFRARLVLVLALLFGVVVVATGTISLVMLAASGEGSVFAFSVAVVTLLAALIGFAVATAPRARALRVLRERHPDAVVFLARRLPSIVSDLPQYLASHDLALEIGDGWYVATVDDEGIGVWTTGRDPQRLLVIPWAELGEIVAVPTPDLGREATLSVAVDVKPYAVPMTVHVGDAWGIVTMALDGPDTTGIVAAVNARRPQPTA